jgi:hypothetical protein
MAIPALTLDHNCIIHYDNQRRPHYAALKELLALHDVGIVRVYLGSISASENTLSGDQPSFEAYEEWIKRLGLERLPQIHAQTRLGMWYLGRCMFAQRDGLTESVQALLHRSLALGYPFPAGHKPDATGPIHPKRRNRFCDIDGIVAHIRAGHDVFVTEDRNFIRKCEALIALGARNILTPERTLQFVRP